ncbi:MAG: glycoside hydrolase family protein [Bacteroidaceae bacterium]|nr:glycoside hydrolase family protein [Bacteroidaceae bacterium]
MKRIVIMIIAGVVWACNALSAKTLTPDTEYYLWLNIYEKLLGSNAEGTAPSLSAYGVDSQTDNYIFVAEESGNDGYVLLRQKSSGRYLAASTSDTWSMVFEDEAKDESRFQWAVDEGTYVYLKSRKSGKYLGVDGANKGKDYVGVFYDKPYGSHSQFTAIPVVGDSWDDARAAYVSDDYTNAQGVTEVDYALVRDRAIDRSDAIDIHVTANTTPIQGSSTINLGSDRTWLILDNIAPSAATSYLKYITINGKRAVNNSNCRVAIFLNGCAIIPLPEAIMTCSSTDGGYSLKVGNSTTLGTHNNTMTSFTLRRGYMVTLASGTKGSGHSRVYVADHADLEVTLPSSLAKRVSSVNLKQWQYLSKKGWGNTGGSSGASGVRATWFWSWSAGYSSTADMEYVPCRQHLYWPSASEVNNKTATAAMSINEPEHSEQHESSDCSCGGTISAWRAYQLTPDFQAGGGRIGSPQPTDLSYLTEFCKYVDENNNQSRCDFTITHSYWDLGSMNSTSYANWYCNTQCKSVWNNTKRPLWITELEISASWNSNKPTSYDQARDYLQVLLQKIDECPWIERYAIYSFDQWQNYVYYDCNPNKGLTPAGQVYRDHRATFAYNASYTKTPAWWNPSTKTPSLVAKPQGDSQITFVITNPNTDMTDQMVVERLTADGSWTPFYEVTDRSLFDNKTLTLTGIEAGDADIETDQFRVTITTLAGKTISSSTTDSGYIQNPRIEVDSKESVDGWTCSRDAANGYCKSTGDTYLEVWDYTAANIHFDYYQELTELADGLYKLTANVFNTADGVEGDTVNGAVGLYARTGEQFYFAPVLSDAASDPSHSLTSSTTDISQLPTVSIDTIVVRDGYLRVGIRNLGKMTARWAGADNFLLQRIGDIPDADVNRLRAKNDQALYALMPSLKTTSSDPSATPRDASCFIVNPDCNRSTSYGWTTKNVDYKTDGEAYDAVASNTYWNIWKSGAYESTLTQEVVGLPEGTYTFAAVLRGQDVATMTLSAATAEASVQQSFVGHGATSAASATYHQGWERVQTDPVTVHQGDTLSLSLAVSCSATAWWSADHFALTLESTPGTADNVRSIVDTSNNPSIFDLTGRRVTERLIHSGRPLQSSRIYLVGGRKIVIK